MDIGAYHRIEGELVRGAAGMFVRARDGMLWQLGKLHDVAHLVGKLVAVEGIRSGVEALHVNWVEALISVAPRLTGTVRV
ncbi:hypothetical protein BH10PSE12_BH10PSE12_25760 [soil metagenome]